VVTVAWIVLSMTLAIVPPKSCGKKAAWFVAIFILGVFALRGDQLQKQEAAEQRGILKDLEARAGNRALLEEVIKLKSKALYGGSAAGERLADLLKQLPEAEANHRALRDQSMALVDQLRLKWEPIYLSFLRQFDESAAELSRAGVKATSIDPLDSPVVIGGVQRGVALVLRTLDVEGFYTLRVRMFPGIVEIGGTTQTPRFWLDGTDRTGARREFLAVNLQPERIDWTLGDIALTERTEGSEPITPGIPESKALDAFGDGLKRAFKFAVLVARSG